MINLKRIKEIEQFAKSDGWEIGDPRIHKEDAELLYLVRLGIWARDRAIPALKTVVGYEPFPHTHEPRIVSDALMRTPAPDKETDNE